MKAEEVATTEKKKCIFVETPTASGKKRSSRFSIGRTPTPEEFVKRWPTPVVSDTTTGAIMGSKSIYYETKTGMPRKVNKTEKDGSLGLGRLVKFFPTPKAQNANAPCLHGEGGIDLQTSVTMWPTPVASDVEHGGQNQRDSKGHYGLSGAVVHSNYFGTPTANDAKNSLIKSQVGRGTLTAHIANSLFPTPVTSDSRGFGSSELWEEYQKEGKTSGYRLVNYVQAELGKQPIAGNGGQLNPDWVEALMGFPLYWTDITKDMVIEIDYFETWQDGSWEAGLPRVIVGSVNRVNRLKCLGNAVVPEIPAIILKMIVRALW